MSHDGLLFLHRHPIEQIHRSCLGIVVARNFLTQQRNQECLQIEIAGQQAEFLEHEFGAPQPLRVFVVQVLGEIGDNFIAAGQLALDLSLDGQAALLAVELENLVHRVEKFFGLARGDLDFIFRRLFLGGGRLGLFGLRRGLS